MFRLSRKYSVPKTCNMTLLRNLLQLKVTESLMVTWKLAKLQRVDDLKNYVQHFTLVMHAYKFFRLASFFLATAFSANEGDIENGDNSRQVKHKGFFSLLWAERYEFTSVRSRHGSFVNQTYDKRFLPPLISLLLPTYTTADA